MSIVKNFRFVVLAMVAVVFLMTSSAVASDSQFRLGVVGSLGMSKLHRKADPRSPTDERGQIEIKDFDSKTGFSFGVIGEYPTNEYFAIATGLVFAQRGGKLEKSEHGDGYERKLKINQNINYLQIPMNAKFSYPINDDLKVFGFTGPYLAFALTGKMTVDYKGQAFVSDSIEMTIDSFSGDVSGNYHSSYGENNYSGNYSGNVSGDVFQTENNGGRWIADITRYTSVPEANCLLLKRADFGLSFGGGVEYKKFFVSIQSDLGLINISKAKGVNYKMSNRNFGISVGYMF